MPSDIVHIHIVNNFFLPILLSRSINSRPFFKCNFALPSLTMEKWVFLPRALRLSFLDTHFPPFMAINRRLFIRTLTLLPFPYILNSEQQYVTFFLMALPWFPGKISVPDYVAWEFLLSVKRIS